MSPAQQALDYRREIDENQKQIREMVMESYHDIADQTYILRVFHMLVDSREKMLRMFRV